VHLTRVRIQWDGDTWTQVASLPISGGVDFKNLLDHLIVTKCDSEDVFFQVWKVAPGNTGKVTT
jgi:hypothetical protein